MLPYNETVLEIKGNWIVFNVSLSFIFFLQPKEKKRNEYETFEKKIIIRIAYINAIIKLMILQWRKYKGCWDQPRLENKYMNVNSKQTWRMVRRSEWEKRFVQLNLTYTHWHQPHLPQHSLYSPKQQPKIPLNPLGGDEDIEEETY